MYKQLASLIVIGLVVLLPETVVAQAGGFVPCGGPGQDDCNLCHLVTMGSRIVNWLVVVLTVVGIVALAYAGFRLVISGGNPTAKDQAKALLVNVIVGYLLVLSAWLIVDTIMKVLTDDNIGDFGPWNRMECRTQPVGGGSLNIRFDTSWPETLAFANQWQQRINSEEPVGNPLLAPELPVAGDCSPESLQAQGMTPTQAQVMSCIAVAESGCQLNAQNPWSSARGVFQVVRGLNSTCHNLNLPQCTQAANAAGYSISGDLNCSTAFRGGTGPDNPSRPREGREELWRACNAAADNFECNTAAARCLLGQGGYGHWLGDPSRNHHLQQRACVARYGQ